MITWVSLILAIIGFILSWYAYHVEQYAGKKKGYRPACDISARVSCTKAFSSVYGTTLGLSNGTWGMLFYIVVITLALFGEIQYIFLLSLLAVLGSLCLAYLLYFRVKTFCVVCTSIYVINIILAVSSYLSAF